MQLTTHFSMDELTASSIALRLCINNQPIPNVQANMLVLAEGLEAVRNLLGGQPMHIDSAYRCEALNRAVGGAKDSAHEQGFAADFICPTVGKPIDIVRLIAQSRIDFDQLIQEGTWVHISFAPTLRRQVLTAIFGPGGTTYREGV